MRADAIQDLDGLKHYLKKAAPHRPISSADCVSTGLESLDQLTGGGFPKGAITVLTGMSGAGRMSLAAKLLARETKQKRTVAWIDAKGTLYPPALEGLGVNLALLLMVRAEPARALFAIHQIAESGAFSVIAANGLESALSSAGLRRLQTAAEAQRSCIALIVEPRAAKRIPEAQLRLHVSRQAAGIVVEVEKNRNARIGRMFHPDNA